MSVLYTVKEDSATLWCICREHTYLATRLGMNEAIRQAGQLAREHHRRTGQTVAVEIASREGTTLLSRYAKPIEPLEATLPEPVWQDSAEQASSGQDTIPAGPVLSESVAA